MAPLFSFGTWPFPHSSLRFPRETPCPTLVPPNHLLLGKSSDPCSLLFLGCPGYQVPEKHYHKDASDFQTEVSAAEESQVLPVSP